VAGRGSEKCEWRVGRTREYEASRAVIVFGDGGEGSRNSNWSATRRWMERLVRDAILAALPNEGNDECLLVRTSFTSPSPRK